MRIFFIVFLIVSVKFKIYTQEIDSIISTPYIIVLGTIQDAGSPHIGCRKNCCKALFLKPESTRKVVSLGIIDPQSDKKYLIEATPDITDQIKDLWNKAGNKGPELVDAIFLTHAHIGHYTGLMYLGREGYNAKNMPVYAMPKMKNFIETNGPWDQLIKINNIIIKAMQSDVPVTLTDELKIKPFIVPHRGEYSETVGFFIAGPKKKALFIPDIDKWHLWEKNIIEEIEKVDYAFLDATFYDSTEVNNRNIAEIPHPFIAESFVLFDKLTVVEKSKIHFIHFNHTNPALDKDSPKAKLILQKGYNIARMGDIFRL